MAEPTPVIPSPPINPHARRAVAPEANADLLGGLDAAAAPALAPGDADDLIARMADQQIDQLLADDEVGRRRPASPGPVLDDVPPLPPLPPIAAPIESTPIEALSTLVPPPAADPAAGVTFPSSFSPPTSRRLVVSDPASGLDAVRAAEASPLDANVGPRLELPPLTLPDVTTPPADDSHELQSSAEAVARELADDILRSPPRGTPPREHDDSHAAAVDVAPSAAVAVDDSASSGLRALPVSLLELINYPARSMSDTGREAMGAIAIVTLANATALLIYLVMFRG